MARNRKAFTYETADLLSYRWRTLEDEGMRFCGFVRRDHPDEAEDLHRAIAQHVKRLAASRVTALKRKKVTP